MTLGVGAEGSILAIHPVLSSRLEVENAGADIGVFSLTDFAFAVKIPYWFDERLENVRMLFSQDVVHLMYGYDVGLSPFQGACNTEQTDEIRVIGVEELSSGMLGFLRHRT